MGIDTGLYSRSMFADGQVKIVNYSRGSPTVQSIVVKDEIWLDDNSLKYYKGVCNSYLQLSLYNYDRNFEQKEIFQQKGRHFKASVNKLVQPLIYVWNTFLFIRTFRLPKKLLFIVGFFLQKKKDYSIDLWFLNKHLTQSIQRQQKNISKLDER